MMEEQEEQEEPELQELHKRQQAEVDEFVKTEHTRAETRKLAKKHTMEFVKYVRQSQAKRIRKDRARSSKK